MEDARCLKVNAIAFLLADRRGLLTKAWRTHSMFSGFLIERSLPGGFFFFFWRQTLFEFSHPQQYCIATRDTVVPNIAVPMKYPPSHDRTVVLKIISTAKAHCLHTSASWLLKCFESHWCGAQGHIPNANSSTHRCVANSSGISAGPCSSAFRVN